VTLDAGDVAADHNRAVAAWMDDASGRAGALLEYEFPRPVAALCALLRGTLTNGMEAPVAREPDGFTMTASR